MIFSKIFRLTLIVAAISCFAKQPKVAVVGAGLAGLTTAYRLHQQGIDVQVYDARNRVGGRIFTVKIGDTIAELGGQNIADGGKAENIRRLVDELHLEFIENQVNLGHSYFDGETLIPNHLLYREFDPEHLKLQLANAAQKSQTMCDVLNELFEKEDPLYKVLSTRMAAYEGASTENLSPFYTETLYYMILGGICSVHQNADHTVDFIGIKGGNALLPEKLAQSLSERVHLNMPLIAISKDSDGSYELTFKNGSKAKADILVLAIPCSVYEDIAFEENIIPRETLEAIQSVQYGTNAKILIPFSQIPPKRMTFLNDRMAGFFDADRRILTLYYTGESGKFSADTLLQTYRQDRPMLEIGFKDLCPPLLAPTFARDESLASYEGPVGYSWPNDPYVKGSYSYIAPGQEALLTSTQSENGETIKTLFAPIGQTLYFAGEHTCVFAEISGTMEAACESGERTARMINVHLRSL